MHRIAVISGRNLIMMDNYGLFSQKMSKMGNKAVKTKKGAPESFNFGL